MRLTLRGIPQETADSIRQLANEAGCTLGQVVTLCVDLGLHEARLQLIQASTPRPDAEDLYSLEMIMADLGQPAVPRK